MKLVVKNNRLGPVINRHPWVFSGALQEIPQGLESGAPVSLHSEEGKFLAQGYFNSYSQISVRLWSFEENETIDEQFFIKRVQDAFELRCRLIDQRETNAYRLINSENDFLPGLIVDKYADYLVLQFHTRGIEKWFKEIVNALKIVCQPKGIYERSDVKVREYDKAEKQSGLIAGDVPVKIKIKENGLLFYVDVITGQKTGFFLDQRDKRQALQKYCEKKTVLNCFSYSGGFSVYALSSGAKMVYNVDASAPALELAQENIKLNKFNVKKCENICEDVKVYLRRSDLPKFDIIILDPPAFIKNRHKIKEGVLGYRKINEAALRLLQKNDILVTCSCSAHLSLEDFRFMLTEAAGRAGKSVQILETFTHGVDHPLLASFGESEYLKCLIVKVS